MHDQEFVRLSVHNGIRIRNRREELGLSLANVAAAVDASAQQLIQYEQGDYDIALDRLFRLAGLLDLSVADLLAD